MRFPLAITATVLVVATSGTHDTPGEVIIGFPGFTESVSPTCWGFWDPPRPDFQCGWFCLHGVRLQVTDTEFTLQAMGTGSDAYCGDCSLFDGWGTISNGEATGVLPDHGFDFHVVHDDSIDRVIFDFGHPQADVDEPCLIEYSVLHGDSFLGASPLPGRLYHDDVSAAVLSAVARDGPDHPCANAGGQGPNDGLVGCDDWVLTVDHDIAVMQTLDVRDPACPHKIMVYAASGRASFRGHDESPVGQNLTVSDDGQHVMIERNGLVFVDPVTSEFELARCRTIFEVSAGCVMGVGDCDDASPPPPSEESSSSESSSSESSDEYYHRTWPRRGRYRGGRRRNRPRGRSRGRGGW